MEDKVEVALYINNNFYRNETLRNPMPLRVRELFTLHSNYIYGRDEVCLEFQLSKNGDTKLRYDLIEIYR